MRKIASSELRVSQLCEKLQRFLRRFLFGQKFLELRSFALLEVTIQYIQQIIFRLPLTHSLTHAVDTGKAQVHSIISVAFRQKNFISHSLFHFRFRFSLFSSVSVTDNMSERRVVYQRPHRSFRVRKENYGVMKLCKRRREDISAR